MKKEFIKETLFILWLALPAIVLWVVFGLIIYLGAI